MPSVCPGIVLTAGSYSWVIRQLCKLGNLTLEDALNSRYLAVAVACLIAIACGSTSPTSTAPSPTPSPSPTPAPTPSPTPTPTPAPTPAPAPTTWTLSGTVTDAATTRPISGARVAVNDGPNAGRSATADANGLYTLSALAQGGFTARATANGYTQADRGVTLTQNTQVSFALRPAAPLSFTGTWRGRIQSQSCTSQGSAFAGLCSGGLADSLTLILTQNGATVTGSINVGGAIAPNAAGTATGNRLSISGIAPNYNGFNVSYEGWATTITGTSMTGGFSIRFFFPSVPGSASFDMILIGVTQTSTSTASRVVSFGNSESGRDQGGESVIERLGGLHQN